MSSKPVMRSTTRATVSTASGTAAGPLSPTTSLWTSPREVGSTSMGESTAVGAWGWGSAELERAAQTFGQIATDHLRAVSAGPVFTPVPPELAARLRAEGWAEEGADLEELAALVRAALSHPFGNGHPRFHAWVNSPPDRAAVLAGQ